MTEAPEEITHDFSRCYWGHNVVITKVIDDGKEIRGSLWVNRRLRVGDFLIIANGEATTRYRVTEREWLPDPGDMYHFTAAFDPRSPDVRDPA